MALAAHNGRDIPTHVLHVLIVEDNEKDFTRIRDAFAEIPGTSFFLQWVETFEEGKTFLTSKTHDLYLIDYQLGSHTALDLLQASPSRDCDPIIIMFTGEEDREIDLQSIRLGASDYLLKPALSGVSLDRTIRYAFERKRCQQERDTLTAQLLQISRRVGIADVASSVLHNVGNILNSVNVTTGLVSTKIRQSSMGNVTRTATMIEEHHADLERFLTQDPKGRLIPQYLCDLGTQLSLEQSTLLSEMEELTRHVEHMKQIIISQQGLARAGGVVERTDIAELIEQALVLALSPRDYERIQIIRQFQEVPSLRLNKHQVLQILINLIRNAADAMKSNAEGRSILTVGLTYEDGEGPRVKIIVADTGVGINPEHFPRVFTAGFTTKHEGHGFGLHSAVQSAQAMEGTLSVESEGAGRGATFILDLPRKEEMKLV